ncbi:MAG: NAD-dependent epimerase/dehydratase family protein [Candidatus Dadabacteria bacterium]|nr:MAG: NAD-dependent epimerase/dehydratase family protein [Candidatus Dadabacteria bacterium]
MKILVTGGAGYLGSLLVPMLLGRGYKVTVLDNFTWGVKPVLHFATHPELKIIGGDVRSRDVVNQAVTGQDMVIHLAAIVGYPACAADRDKAISTNVEGTRNIVEAARGKKLIFASTGSTYGKVEGICTEESPIDPLTLYGSTKWEAEKMITDAGGVALRFATVFGVSPRLRLDLLVNDFVYQAVHARQIILYEGHFRRTFLHCRDAARSYLTAIDYYDKMAGEAFNVGDNSMNFTKRQVAEKVREQIDFYLHEAAVGEDQDKRDYAVSYDKIGQFGYKAEVSLEEGIAELLKVVPYIHITNEWRNA